MIRFYTKQQVFLDFVLSHYVSVGVDELDQEKLTPLLRLKYHDSLLTPWPISEDRKRSEGFSVAFSGFCIRGERERGDAMNSYCDIAASDGSGSMKAYLAMPTGKPKAGIVVIQEILGVNNDIRAMTDAWAANGYAAITPTCSGG